MAIGELISANVLDRRFFEAQGETGQTGIYLLGLPGRALPFAMYRAWKVPTGLVTEEIRFTGPSGRLVYRWGPEARQMLGSMNSTAEVDVIEDAVFDEAGGYLVSFILNGEIIGEIETTVLLQAAADKHPKEFEDGLKKSDTIWVGTGEGAFTNNLSAPVWFAYKNGKIYVLHQKEPGPEEQSVPGLPDAKELLVVTRRKGRDTAKGEFHAGVRLLESGPEFDEAAKLLVDKRKSRGGPPADSLNRWKGTCLIAELTPLV
jgi:hypothetical protein